MPVYKSGKLKDSQKQEFQVYFAKKIKIQKKGTLMTFERIIES